MRDIKDLLCDGYTWEEAEAIVWHQVEQARDYEKDRRLEEMLEQKQTKGESK